MEEDKTPVKTLKYHTSEFIFYETTENFQVVKRWDHGQFFGIRTQRAMWTGGKKIKVREISSEANEGVQESSEDSQTKGLDNEEEDSTETRYIQQTYYVRISDHIYTRTQSKRDFM